MLTSVCSRKTQQKSLLSKEDVAGLPPRKVKGSPFLAVTWTRTLPPAGAVRGSQGATLVVPPLVPCEQRAAGRPVRLTSWAAPVPAGLALALPGSLPPITHHRGGGPCTGACPSLPTRWMRCPTAREAAAGHGLGLSTSGAANRGIHARQAPRQGYHHLEISKNSKTHQQLPPRWWSTNTRSAQPPSPTGRQEPMARGPRGWPSPRHPADGPILSCHIPGSPHPPVTHPSLGSTHLRPAPAPLSPIPPRPQAPL